MGNDPSLLLVDVWVEEHACDPIERFYPSLVSIEVNLPISTVFTRLYALAEQQKLELILEIHCPACGTKVGDFTRKGGISKQVKCSQCDNEFSVDAKTVFLAFRFAPDYIEVKKKFKHH